MLISMISSQTILHAAATLKDAAPPGSRVVLFGSYAKGHPRPDSDLDFMVIEPHVSGRHAEINRLARVLRPLRLPVDVLVTSEATFLQWKDAKSTIYNEVATSGKVLYG